MKIAGFIFTLFFLVNLFAQDSPVLVKNDRPTFKVGFSIGAVSYHIDEIKDMVGFSNESWNYADSFYAAKFYHEKTNYLGRTFLLKFGCHFPLFQRNQTSVAFEPIVGIGGQKQLRPVHETSYTVGENDKLSSLITDVEGYLVGRYYFKPRNFLSGKIGIRRISAVDKYITPIASISYGYQWLELGFYTHLYRRKYYREFSNGEFELAQSIYQFGIKLSAHFWKKSN